ncbi:Branched-chain amino acid transport protein, partial [Lactiplantibacillus plantarum]
MRNLAVYASELVPNTGQQLTLFTDPQRQIKAERLNGVIDEIHRRFGFLSYKAWLR